MSQQAETAQTSASAEPVAGARTISDLVSTRVSLEADTPVREVVAFFESHPELDAMAVLDADGAIGLVSRARLHIRLSQRFGYAVFERRPIRLLMERPLQVDASADPAEVAHAALSRPSEQVFDDFVVVDGGGYVGLVSMRALLAHEKEVLRKSLTRATDLDQKTRELQEQVSQMQKMEAVGRLAGGIAHDFNNLLSVIMGYAEGLRRRPDDPAGCAQKVDGILAATERAAAVTRQLLAFSRKQVVQPKVVDLNGLVADSVKILERLIGEDVKLRMELGAHLGRIKVDPGQFQQVLMNLVVNARDAMPQGGELTLVTRRATDSQVALDVRDNGTGMSEETRQRIFEPFFTTKPTGKGTGLGLSTVYGIVSQAGGRVDVETELGRGTSFTVFWPTTDEAASRVPSARPRPVPVASETVLLVEDEPEVRKMMAEALAREGYRVLEAAHAEDALWLARAKTFDLLVTDVVMPGLSGKALARRLASLRPHAPVLYVSGYTADTLSDHGVLHSDVALLEKPFSTQELLGRVRQMLDGIDRTARPAPRRSLQPALDQERRRA